MKKKSLITIVVLIILVFSFAGCKGSISETPKDNNTFDSNAATKIVDDYMRYLIKEDFDNVKKLFSEHMVKEEVNYKNSDVVVKGYRIEDNAELAKTIVFKVKVVSVKKKVPYAILDEYRVEVIKEKDGYKISEVKITPEKEAFHQGAGVRIRDKNNVQTNLVIDMESMPKFVFPQDDKLNIYKQDIPRKEFGNIGLSYDGMRLITSTYNKDSYAAVVSIDETTAVQGTQGQDGKAQQNGGGEQKGSLGGKEKTIGKEITSLDFIKDSYVDYMVFSQDEKFIVIQYTKSDNTKCVRVYESDSGKGIPVKFEESYPINKLDVVFSYFQKDAMIFEVLPKKNIGNEEKDLIGTWQLDLKDFTIKKI